MAILSVFSRRGLLLLTAISLIAASAYGFVSAVNTEGLFTEPETPQIQFGPVPRQAIEAQATTIATVRQPMDLAFDQRGRAYILEHSGAVLTIDPDGRPDPVPYLILANEHTLVLENAPTFPALAMHPGYTDPDSIGFGCFYTIETEYANTRQPDFVPEFGPEEEHHQDVIYEYRSNDPTARVFSGTRREVLRVSQPGAAHNVSDLKFDRTGNLYIAIGDGAECEPGTSTVSKNAMALTNVYGKVLRIDPLGRNSANGRYGIPRTNPFRMLERSLPEVWCYGLRRPTRLHTDLFHDWLCIAEVGQANIEEINLSKNGGEHFGWDLCEGTFFYPPNLNDRKPSEGVTAPLVEFAHVEGDTASGGVFYRGNTFFELRDRLLFGTTGGRLMAADIHSGDSREIVGPNGEALFANGISSLRTGPGGEIYVLCRDGKICRLDRPKSSTENQQEPATPAKSMALLCMIVR